MGNERQDSPDAGKDRIDLDRAVEIRFQKFQDFLTEIAGNISPGGMFVKTDDPHPPGEQFEFACSLADGFPLVRGRGEVVWIREESQSDTQPAGMGVRFLELFENSGELIEKIVENRQSTGEDTFDLEAAGVLTSPSGTETQWALLDEEIDAATERLVPGTEASDLDAAESAPRGGEAPEPEAPAESLEIPADIEPEVEEIGLEEADSTPAPDETQVRPAPRIILPETPEIEPLPADVPRPQMAASPSARVQKARDSRVRPTLGRLVELLVLSALIAAGIVLAFNQFWVRPRIESLESRLEDLTGDSKVGGAPGRRWLGVKEAGANARSAEGDSEQTTGGLAAAAPQTVPEPVAEPDHLDPAVLTNVVQAWATAWSERSVDDYLDFYSASFKPSSGATRAQWSASRRDRLLNQGAIRVAVVSVVVEDLSPTEQRVTFTQSYRSEVFRDRVRKSLRMVWEDGGWKIAEEVVIRKLPW